MNRLPRLAALALLVLPLGAAPATMVGSGSVSEQRCGWIQNPTPGNWWLVDADGEWTIGTQGGETAEGMEHIPDLTTSQWVRTNGTYGYGCGCMKVETDAGDMRVTRITSYQRKPLSACRSDKKLPAPE